MSEECSYCGDLFDDTEQLHLHWGENHKEELTSHQEESYRKAKKRLKEQQEAEQQRRRQKLRKIGGYAIFIALFIGIGGLIAGQMQISTGQDTETESNFDLDGQPMLGEEDAPVTVVEFSDYQCPHCKRFHESVLPRLKENYIDTGQVKLYSMNFAFLGPGSETAAIGAECVYEEGGTEAYQEYSDAVYNRQNQLGNNASSLVIDVATSAANSSGSGLEQCITDRQTIPEVQQDLQQGQANNVQGTPTIFVDGRQLSSYDYGTVSAAIEAALD